MPIVTPTSPCPSFEPGRGRAGQHVERNDHCGAPVSEHAPSTSLRFAEMDRWFTRESITSTPQDSAKAKLVPQQFHALVQKFQDANFFEMSGGGIVIDASVRTVSVDMNGRHKELKEGCACPPELVRLEDEVGKTAGSERWVRGRLRVFLHWPWMRS